MSTKSAPDHAWLFPVPSPGMCDWGRCCAAATMRVRCTSVRTEKVVEVRHLCISHMVDFATTESSGGEYTFDAASV